MTTGATNYVLDKHAARTQTKQSTREQGALNRSDDAQEVMGRGYVEPDLKGGRTAVGEEEPGSRFGGFGFGKQKEKKSGFWDITRPIESLPREFDLGSFRHEKLFANY